MNDTAPNVIVIPAKVETPQDRRKSATCGCRLLPGATDSEEQLSSYENQLSYYTRRS